jgi:hypothetical protein
VNWRPAGGVYVALAMAKELDSSNLFDMTRLVPVFRPQAE